MSVNTTEKKKKQSLRRVLSNNMFIWKICFKECPWLMTFFLFEGFKGELFIFIEHTIGINYVLECAEFGRPFLEPLIFLVSLTIALSLTQVFGGYVWHNGWLKAMPRIIKRAKTMLYEKAATMDLSCYDDAEYYNELILSLDEASKTITRCTDLLKNVVSALTVLITTGCFFLAEDALSTVIVLIVFILQFALTQLLSKLNFKIRVRENPIERKRSYVNRVFYLADYAKEIRLNPDIKNKLYADFEETNDELYSIEKKSAFKRTLLTFFKDTICNALTMDVLYIGYLVFSAVVLKTISISNIVVLRNSAWRLKNSVENITGSVPQAYEASLYIEKLRGFLAYETKITSAENLPVEKSPKQLSAENITFAYNEKDGCIINGVSFDIKPHEKIALVGYNGAGKTTLIKLMMRLYDPTSGIIRFDGKDIKKYSVGEYRGNIGAVFQDFKLFAATVAENVTLDSEGYDEERVRRSLEKSGFAERLASMPEGLSTPLTTEFDDNGVNLSGGESQKLAIARVFYKDCGLIILDEPSSALDPIAEYQLNKYMLEAAEDKTVIFISHRLSTTRHADRIFMLENGRIIECGSHDELIKLNGKYAEMWHAQAKYYVS